MQQSCVCRGGLAGPAYRTTTSRHVMSPSMALIGQPPCRSSPLSLWDWLGSGLLLGL